jgi:hypothetical protein
MHDMETVMTPMISLDGETIDFMIYSSPIAFSNSALLNQNFVSAC